MELKPDYKRTEAGIIPSDWDVVPLGKIGDALIGLTYRPEDVRPHGTLVLRASNIQNDKLSFDDNVYVGVEVPEQIMVRPGDVLVCVRNGSRNLIGKAALLDERCVGMTFGAFMAVHRGQDGRLVNYLFQSEVLKRQINEHLGATINQITNRSLNAFSIPFPPTDSERESIGKALSDVDALLDGLDRLIAKKRDLKRATMQQLLTGKTRLPGFDGKWTIKRLGDLLAIRHGKSQREIETDDGQYPILATSGEIGRASRPLYDKPSVLIGRKGTINNPQYMESPFWSVDTLFFSEMKGESHARYLYYLFCTIDWMQFNEASGVPSLNARTVENIEVDCPSPDEQRAIAGVLSDMDAELAAVEGRRHKTNALKQAMMQELLTGKTRLIAKESSHAGSPAL